MLDRFIYVLVLYMYLLSCYAQNRQASFSTSTYKKGKGEMHLFTNLYQERSPSKHVHFLNIFPECIYGVRDNLNVGLRLKLRSVDVAPDFQFLSSFDFKTINANATPYYQRQGISTLSFMVRHDAKILEYNASIQHILAIPMQKKLSDYQRGFLDWDGVSLQSQIFLNRYSTNFNHFIELSYLIENISNDLFNNNGYYIPLTLNISYLPGYYINQHNYFYLLCQLSPKIDFIKAQENKVSFNSYGQLGVGYKYFFLRNYELESIISYFNYFKNSPQAMTYNLGIRKYFRI
jgi:hypothetical protein